MDSTGYCYYKLPELLYTWNEAFSNCSRLGEGVSLVTVTSKGEDTFLYENYWQSYGYSWWLGATLEVSETQQGIIRRQ